MSFNGRGRTSLSLQGFKFLLSCSSVARCSDYEKSLFCSDVGKFIRIIKNLPQNLVKNIRDYQQV